MSIKRHIYAVLVLLLGGLLFPGLTVHANTLSDAKDAYGAGQFEEAVTLLRPLVRQKDKDAAYLLGRMYEQGDGVSKDLEEAKRLFKIAAEQGHEEAQQRLDIFDARGADQSVVVEWYLPAAHDGDTEAQYNLGFMYETGWGVPVNEKEAVKWYREAAEMQHDVAQLRLGMMTILGVGTTANQQDGVDLIRSSAENGNRIAEAIIQDIYDVGELKPEQSSRIIAGLRRILDEGEAKTLETLRKSLRDVHKRKPVVKTETAKLASPPARQKQQTFNIVKSVTKSQIKKDAKKTTAPTRAETTTLSKEPKPLAHAPKGSLLQFYLESAKRGDADAQYHLGAMYLKGDQVRRDREEGVYWIKLAAEQGHEMANTYMELWDEDVSTDALNATVGINWLKESARDWNMDAVFNLGFLYESGRGVPVNFKRATKFYRFAAVEGHVEAKRRLALLKKGKGALDENIRNSNMPGAKTIPPAVIVGVLIMVLALLAIFFYFRKDRQLKMPTVELEEKEVYSKANATQGLEADDRKFFDELWTDSKVGAEQESRAVSPGKDKGKEKAGDEEPQRVEAEKSPELSEVERKLAAAVEDLIGVKNVKAPPVEPAKPEAPVIKQEKVEKVPEVKIAEKPVEAEARPVVKPVAEKPVKAEPEVKKPEPVVREAKPVAKPENVITPSRFGADDFMNNSISRDALASSRVSADNLFADGVAIDGAGKAVGRAGFNPQKLNADNILSSDDISIQAGEKKKPVAPQKTFGPAAGLLPKRSIEEEIEQGVKEIHQQEERKPVDVDAPFTEHEEKSLAEVHYNIGLMFSTGDGVPRNDAQAAKWFLKAAEEGMPEAQYSIAECYLHGTGIAKNAALSREWMEKAAEAGYQPAKEALSRRNQAI
ncbi:MAG: hypothetical protein R3240_01500 [Gammaproteobacteria bacterium]|nr:hypothetical protein [Gammaproteobacteria bacterium]